MEKQSPEIRTLSLEEIEIALDEGRRELARALEDLHKKIPEGCDPILYHTPFNPPPMPR